MSKLLTTAQVMKRYGVDADTVTNWIKAGCPVSKKRKNGKTGQPINMFNPDRLKAWVLVNARPTKGEDGETVRQAAETPPVKTETIRELGIMGCMERTRQQERNLFGLVWKLVNEGASSAEIGNASRAHTQKTAELRQVEMTALEWQEKTNKLVSIADAKQLFSELSSGTRERVMAIPNQVVPLVRQYLQSEDDSGKVRDIIDDALRHALTALPDVLPEKGKK